MTVFSHPDLTLQDLQEQATSKPGLGQPEDELGGITLRSVFWRIYLGTLDISQVLSTAPRAVLRESLQNRRESYDRLRRKWLVSPDGRWATDCTQPDGDVERQGGLAEASAMPSEAWDPLNLGESVCHSFRG
jgi:TBC1 domain family protein 5